MGRQETAVDPTQGPLQRFACDLQVLRRRAGEPTYRSMSRSAGVSASVLSEAAKGRRLPTLQATLAFVRACGVDPAAEQRWQEYWEKTRADLTKAAAAVPVPRSHGPVPGDSDAAVAAKPADDMQPHADGDATTSAPPVPQAESAQPTGPKKQVRWRRRTVFIGALVVLLAVAGGFGIVWGNLGSDGQIRMNFANNADRWWVLYGPQVARIQTTTSITYRGDPAEIVTVAGASASKGYSAVGISHGLDTLHAGMKVTLHLWVPGPQEGGVSFLVHDSHGINHWAVENQGAGTRESEFPLPSKGGWSTVVWTVPAVDRVTTIGMQTWAENDQPLLVGVADVAW